MGSQPDQPPLVVIVGETASGKSKLALELARRFNGEIISADSWTVRRGVDIGTAKPSPKERNEIPHHLVDIIDPCQDFTAAVFNRLANETILDIAGRGKIPIMAGGTGLYVDGVIFGYSFLPAAEKALREQLNQMDIRQLLLFIQQRNYSLDNIDIRNKRRLIRLIETNGARPARNSWRPNTLLIGLSLPREELRERIEERTKHMIAAGLEGEVKHLAEKYGWDCEALKGIGYQEWRLYFEGVQDIQTTQARIMKDTLALAKRQRTWFKRNQQIQWISKMDDAVELVTTFLNK